MGIMDFKLDLLPVAKKRILEKKDALNLNSARPVRICYYLVRLF